MEWPLTVAPVEVALRPLPGVLSQSPRVTLDIVHTNMLIEDAISRTVEVLIRETSRQTILFRSAPTTITPDQEEAVIPLAAVPDVTAERGTRLRLEVRDSRSEAVLDGTDSILMVTLEGW